MFIETRKQGKKKKYYLIHSYRENNKVKRISKYLGSDLNKKEIEKLRNSAKEYITQQIQKQKTHYKENKELKKIKPIIVRILKKNGVVKAGIFGSYARGEQKKKSDIDILIKVKRKKFSLLDLVGLELELKKALKRKVDLLTYECIHPLLKDRILNEEVRII
jgi:predicted nucleotidyltransferase